LIAKEVTAVDIVKNSKNAKTAADFFHRLGKRRVHIQMLVPAVAEKFLPLTGPKRADFANIHGDHSFKEVLSADATLDTGQLPLDNTC
jgi:hypothetical protein